MTRAWWAAFCLLWCVPAAAQYFGGGAQQMGIAKFDDDGRLVITQSQVRLEQREATVPKTVYTTEQRTRTVERDGQQVTEAYTVQVPQTVMEKVTFTVNVPVFSTTARDASGVTSAEVSGRAVEGGDLAKRLRTAAPVLVGSGQPLPDYYKLVFKPETLVLTVPQQVPPPFVPGQAPPQPAEPPAVAEPGSPPPDVVFASFTADGMLAVRRYNEYRMTQRMKSDVIEGGEPATFEVGTVSRMSYVTNLPANSITVTTAGGQEVATDALRQSLKKEGAAVASMDGKPVDPIWLGALKPATLVIDGPEPDFSPGSFGGNGTSAPAAGPVPPAKVQPAPQPGSPTGSQPASPQPVPPADAAEGTAGAKHSADEQTVIDAVNDERKKAGLKPVKAEPALMRAARGHAEAMAKANELNHTLGGKTMEDRLAAAGFQFQQAGENIAQGARTPAEAVSDWMSSPGHRANILTAGYQRTGVGVATSASGERFWCQVFGTPWDAPPTGPAAVPVAAP